MLRKKLKAEAAPGGDNEFVAFIKIANKLTNTTLSIPILPPTPSSTAHRSPICLRIGQANGQFFHLLSPAPTPDPLSITSPQPPTPSPTAHPSPISRPKRETRIRLF